MNGEIINRHKCQYFQQVNLKYIDHGIQPIGINMLEHCINLTKIYIKFLRVVTFAELRFLLNLPKLKVLKLTSSFRGDNHIGYCPLTIFTLVNTISLEFIEIKWNLFGNLAATGEMFQYFVNFGIKFEFLPILPNNIFVQLSKVKSLQQIEIIGIPGLNNEMFTHLCESQRSSIKPEDYKKNELVPAITALNQLICISIEFCQGLTDTFVTDGIALSKTLIGVILSNMRQPNVSFVAMRKCRF